MTTVNPSALAYVGAAYGWMPPTDPLLNPANTSSGQNNNSAATNVTVSDAARALLATQNADDDFAMVTANARIALDDLYKAAGVTSPLQDDKLTIDLSGLDRISVFAIASNSEKEFTADEQSAAAQELQNRFDAAMKPMKAAAEVVGDYSSLYKAALSYFDGMSAKEKAAPGWADQRAALAAGYQATQQNPGALPQGIANDPIAAFVKRTEKAGDTDNDPAANFATVATKARQAIDAQAAAATAAGKQLVFDPQRKSGQLVDFSSFDNQSLSAVALNQGNLFAPEESRAAKQELDARTRKSILQVFQGGSGSDPRSFSLGLIQQYQIMTPEQRQAAGLSSSFLDLAVANYKSTTSLMSMFAQASGGSSTGNSGTSLLDYLS